MESTHLEWRLLARRQWPLACALLFFLGIDLWDFTEHMWRLPGVLVVCALAVLAPRRPFDAALAAATALMATSVVQHVVGIAPGPQAFYSGASVTETAAAMALVAILIRQSPRWRAVLGTLAVVAAMLAAEFMRPNWYQQEYGRDEFFAQRPGDFVVGAAVLLVLSVGTGLYFRARDRERTRSVEAEVTAAQHAERMALARELHDVVAHYVTAIVVHAQAGQVNRTAAEQVLPVIANSGNEALTAMRRLVGTLRGSEPAGSSAASPTNDLLDDVRVVAEESGQPVRLTFDLVEQVPPELGRSVLRLVQESLTNSRKHAGAVSRVDVSVSTKDGVVHVHVADDGRPHVQAPVGGSGGYGLVGMRERVELLGGRFSAGKREPGGWEVRAELPIA